MWGRVHDYHILVFAETGLSMLCAYAHRGHGLTPNTVEGLAGAVN